MEQGTETWFAARAGKLTGSRFAALMSSGKGHDDLIKDLAWERYTGKCIETYCNDAMRRGTELEPEARRWYSFITDTDVTEDGFIVHDSIPNVGVSPDGLIGGDGLIEIKCPGHRAHIETLEKNKIPSQYRWQVQGQLWVCGRRWLDFISYHPEHVGVIIRVLPSADDHLALAAACTKANEEIEKIVKLLADKEALTDG